MMCQATENQNKKNYHSLNLAQKRLARLQEVPNHPGRNNQDFQLLI